MAIPLKIHEIRLVGSCLWPLPMLVYYTSAMSRFALLYAEAKAILEEAKNDPKTLHVITAPEGMISCIDPRMTHASEAEYQFMIKALGKLSQEAENVLLIPGTIAYPDGKKEDYSFNPAPIFYRDQFFEYHQRNHPPTHKVVLNNKNEFSRLGERVSLDVEPTLEGQKPIIINFQNKKLRVMMEICIDHANNSLKSCDITISNTLQIVLSNSIETFEDACYGSTILHTDIYEKDSLVHNKPGSIFDVKEIRRHEVSLNFTNCMADIVESGCFQHWSHSHTVALHDTLPKRPPNYNKHNKAVTQFHHELYDKKKVKVL